MKIVLLLGLGCVICGTAQAQVRCPPYCAATPITRVPPGSAVPQQRSQLLQQKPLVGFGNQRLNAIQNSVRNPKPREMQNPGRGFGNSAPMQQSQTSLETIQNPAGGFGSAAPQGQSQLQPPIQGPSGGFVNSGLMQQPTYNQQQQTYYQQQPNYYQQPIYYQSQPDYYQQVQQDQPTYYQPQQPVYRLTCQTQSLLCDAYQAGSCSCRSAITGGVEYGSTN